MSFFGRNEYDRQTVSIVGPITTTSTSFVDIVGATLTTVDLMVNGEGGKTGNYEIFMSVSVQNTNNNTSVSFRAVINAVPGQTRTVDFGPNSSNTSQHATLIGQADNVPQGTNIQIEWMVSGGTGQINGLRMLMGGIPQERVIEQETSPGVDGYLTEDASALLNEDSGFLVLENGATRERDRW